MHDHDLGLRHDLPRLISRRRALAVMAGGLGYEQSVQTLAQLSLDSDMVFADGYEQQLATAAGDPDAGYALTLDVGV